MLTRQNNWKFEWNKPLDTPISIHIINDMTVKYSSTQIATRKSNGLNSRLKVTALTIKKFKVFISI